MKKEEKRKKKRFSSHGGEHNKSFEADMFKKSTIHLKPAIPSALSKSQGS